LLLNNWCQVTQPGKDTTATCSKLGWFILRLCSSFADLFLALLLLLAV
jgi:hypothetical protein